MMKLADTVEGMNSVDYQERFIAEYQQLVIRYRGLTNMLNKWDRGVDLGFSPTCPRSTYNTQVETMADYIAVLEARAMMEGIDLDTSAAPLYEEAEEQNIGLGSPQNWADLFIELKLYEDLEVKGNQLWKEYWILERL